MKVTFIVKLMVELINILESKGFEINDTNMTEKNIEVLTFRKDDDEYDVSVSTVINDINECLLVTGTIVRANLCSTSYQITKILKGLKFPDHITVATNENEGDEYSVNMTKYYKSKFDMEGVNKNNLRAIAMDIIDGITAL